MSTQNSPAGARYSRVLSYSESRILLDAALAAAEEIGVPASVAILDASREIVAFARQDFAPVLTGEVAIAKAFTSISLRQRSADLATAADAGGAFAGLHHASQRSLATFGGGLPLFDGDNIIGAIGASGGSIEEDLTIATAALAAFDALPTEGVVA